MIHRKSILILGILTLTYFNASFAQTSNNTKEALSGYKGNFIDGLQVQENGLNFLAIGDWGRCGEYFQKEVAEQLSNASITADASFILSTGDNFYPVGVKTTEDPLWKSSFEDVYNQFSLQKNWYVALGNHDYKTNPEAEIQYTAKSSRWKMPQRYYSFTQQIGDDSTKLAQFIIIDTNPLINKYYSEGEFRDQLIKQDTAKQIAWLIQTLKQPDPRITWRFVIGHHPLYTSGKRIKSEETFQFRKRMKAIFDDYKVDAYICGHEHQLEITKPEGYTTYIISGAGSEVRPIQTKLPESTFAASEHGFMVFSLTEKQLQVTAVNHEGKILHKATVIH